MNCIYLIVNCWLTFSRHFLLTDVCSSKFVEPAKTAVYEFQSDTVLRAQRSPSRQQHQPSRIEDYEPGRCSLAVDNGIEVC